MLFSKFSAVTLVALSWSGCANAQHIVTRGVQDGLNNKTGARPFRMNILDLQKDPYAWPLYIQSLVALKNVAETDPNSYFQVSGIHGRPYIAWDNVYGQVNYSTGYCTHDSILFLTWHRPYLALFEQVLHSHALSIANKYTGPNSAKYQAAAKTLRLPYWDWAVISNIPDVVAAPTINITTPKGAKLITNPLYRYEFPYRDPNYFPTAGGDGFLAADPTTVRDPSANLYLANAQLKMATYNLFTHVPDYTTFATQASGGASLEGIHGIVHVDIGGSSGDMSYLSYAAFDPIFWLHHTNIDRLFALFEAINPDWWFPAAGFQDNSGTFTIDPGTIDNSSTSLTPFSQSASGTPWTSDGSRSLAPFGYSYPEIEDWHQTPTDLARNVTVQFNTLYGPSVANSRREIYHEVTAREWFVNIAVDKCALDTSFTVNIFFGEPPADPITWKKARSFVSLVVVFKPSGYTCRGNVKTYGEIPLKERLKNAGLEGKNSAEVATYLTKNLYWGIQKINGTVVDVSQIPSLKIQVTEEEVTLPDSVLCFPKYGAKTYHPEITRGKPGGENC